MMYAAPPLSVAAARMNTEGMIMKTKDARLITYTSGQHKVRP